VLDTPVKEFRAYLDRMYRKGIEKALSDVRNIERTSAALEKWLIAHPDIFLVTRDRFYIGG
jgi:hypothetical protein